MRDFQLPGRSCMYSLHGMAGTSHPASTLAAIDMLKSGGNAIDAAVTAAAVQAVVEPHSTGIGGDCFVLYAPEGGTDIVALNGSGHAPAAATAEWYDKRGIRAIEITGPHAVSVPGSVDAWAKLLDKFGTRTLADVLAPAIAYAEEGYVVHARSSHDWSRNVDKLKRDENAARIFLPDGRSPPPGYVFRQPELAETLRTVASEGRDGFYQGRVAEEMVAYLSGLGGLHSLDDFASQQSEFVTPIQASYRGFDVYECPPNGQGLAVLLMLRILEGFDLSDYEPLSAERMHLEAEATRLAYHICDQFVADTRQVEVPVEQLLGEESIRKLRARVRIDRSMTDIPTVAPMHPETIYISVVDKDRNSVSLINSICFAFGSGLVTPRTGIVLQNRGAGFVLDPSHPNCIAPRKRPRHTIIPGLASKDGRAVLPFGVMGGQFQPVGQVHVLTNMVDFGMNVQQAIDLPRGFHFGGIYGLEKGISEGTARGLVELGHQVERSEMPMGSGQAVWIDWRAGTLCGGSDQRKDGMALGY